MQLPLLPPIEAPLAVVGLDPAGRSLQVVCMEPKGACCCHVSGRYIVDSLAVFRSFWRVIVKTWAGPYRDIVLAVPGFAPDPMGAVDWLARRGFPPEPYQVRTDPGLDPELAEWGLSWAYARAYSVAQSAIYRRLTPQMTSSLLLQLRALRADLDRLTRELELIALASEPPF